ncbi:(2Fe-2S)-binding protein [Vibrio sp.]|uniref:Bacterioferritin-associated ferredoxin n=1 Tax=Vibrio viridaestus TaxID=2487322 RepID=A0A3N9TVZ7_9VIBR|nr:(2Fe-2S)-binding protein [Vibrio viridaestus]MDC0612374.1 (2Fe-2S)-binding protein [Vibrio sp.]RQW61072.1 (2Fe-2S)-binding protein [Vibrio viridaestus]
MIVCVCHSVSDKTLKKLVLEKNITDFREIRRCTALGSQCGKCVRLAKEVVNDAISVQYLEAS